MRVQSVCLLLFVRLLVISFYQFLRIIFEKQIAWIRFIIFKETYCQNLKFTTVRNAVKLFLQIKRIFNSLQFTKNDNESLY